MKKAKKKTKYLTCAHFLWRHRWVQVHLDVRRLRSWYVAHRRVLSYAHISLRLEVLSQPLRSDVDRRALNAIHPHIPDRILHYSTAEHPHIHLMISCYFLTGLPHLIILSLMTAISYLCIWLRIIQNYDNDTSISNDMIVQINIITQ